MRPCCIRVIPIISYSTPCVLMCRVSNGVCSVERFSIEPLPTWGRYGSHGGGASVAPESKLPFHGFVWSVLLVLLLYCVQQSGLVRGMATSRFYFFSPNVKTLRCSMSLVIQRAIAISPFPASKPLPFYLSEKA